MHHLSCCFRNMTRKIFTFGCELWLFYINTPQDQHKKPIKLRVQPGFQWILTVGFCLVIFKGTEQVESNIKNTLVFTAARSRNLNWIPHDKEHIQHHRAGTFPSHGFPFIFGFTPFTPRKRGSLLKKATESARLAEYIIDLLYIIDFCYCHRSGANIY